MFVVRFGMKLLRFSYWLQDSLVPPHMRIADLAFTSYTQAEVSGAALFSS
jgi:hypothetical protein